MPCGLVFHGTTTIFSYITLPFLQGILIDSTYFPLLAVGTVVAVMALSTNPLVISSSQLDKEGTLVGNDTDKLEGELEHEPLFLALHEKYFNKDIALLIE